MFGEFSEKREDLILNVVEYLEAMKIIDRRKWEKLEKELLAEGIFKKGGFMDIRKHIEERGRQKGRLEGRLKGRLERDKEVVLNMLKNRLDTSLICKVTGLSKEEIKKLKNGI